ncbi:uncharacterized protein LOC116131378 [Pistacia vera]|uniref:uncharacterized protein LOC116131378 n=1 Tax=Pistacia vera TaxID=55513 RepID=UPI001263DE6A|nr:uncharacterized protein LOC116131378 [Pistacia vera]
MEWMSQMEMVKPNGEFQPYKNHSSIILERVMSPMLRNVRNSNKQLHHMLNAPYKLTWLTLPVRDVGRIGVSTTPHLVGGHDHDHDDDDDDDDVDPYGSLLDDEQKRILEIKEHLEDLDLFEDSLIDLLQSLADMDITFKALKETKIGRIVNQLRKHSSNDVRRLVKHLVR